MLRDLRFAFHLLVKERWYSAVAIVALALGIGVNATVFTLVNAILIRGLPYRDSAHLYMLGSQRQSGDRSGVSALDFQDWKAQSKSFADLAAFSNNGLNVSDDRSAPQNARSASLSSNVFPLLAVHPLIGRNFTPEDEKAGAESVTIIGYAMWKSRYAEDRGILGKSLRLDGKPMENGRQLQVNLYSRAVGDTVRLDLERRGTGLTLSVPVVEREDDPYRFTALARPEDHLVARLGVLGLSMTSDLAALLPDLRVDSGVVVAGVSGEVVPGSDGQLEAGDVIHALNGTAVRTLPELRALVDALKIGDAIVLQVERDAELLYVTLRVEK